MSALQMTCGPTPDVTSVPVLETERLILRAPCLADAKAIAQLAGNRKVAAMTAHIPHPYTLEDAVQWIASLPAETKHWKFGLIRKEDEKLIGACGFTDEDVGMTVGYWIGEPHWGEGYATEAVRAVIDHIFSATPLDEIAAACLIKNHASRRVLEKCGFQWKGAALLRVRSLGASAPADSFRLERRTWASLRAWGQSRLPKVASDRP
jgi:RimJ/RimL family protein N-acetyltransferase